MTSQMSMPIGSNVTFSSFTSAMFTARYVFSRILTASAARAEETLTTRSRVPL